MAQILAVHRRGPGDPTYRVDARGGHWLAMRTPLGPATLLIEAAPGEQTVIGTAWGPGAEWALETMPELLGAADDPSGFEPRHPLLVEALRHHPHWRIGRTGRLMESLLPAIIEQKVTGQEAFAGFRDLVRRHGEPAPGPGSGPGLSPGSGAGSGPGSGPGARSTLLLQPSPEVLAAIPSWEWLRLHIDPARSRTIVAAARVAGSLERVLTVDEEEADHRLRSLPGVGVWTSAETRARARGDADAVSFGDYHVAADIGFALTGRPVDDAELAVLLAPWRPHRYRVQTLLRLVGVGKPRRGPRMAPRRHLPAPTPGFRRRG